MEANTLIMIMEKFVTAFGHVFFFRKDDALACAPLFAGGGVDWDSWTMVQESPAVDKEQMRRMLLDLGFHTVAVERIIARIGWY